MKTNLTELTARKMLKQLIEHYCDGNKSKFAAKVGVSPQNLSQWLSRGTFDAHLLYTNCEGLNPAWLITGQGDMLTEKPSAEAPHAIANGDNSVATAATNSVVDIGNALGKERIQSLKALIEEKERLINEKEKLIKEKDEHLKENSRHLQDKDRIIALLLENQPSEVRQKWDKIATNT